MGVAYFVRGGGERWAVIRLYDDDQEEVVQGGLTLVEAEILCVMKLEDLLTRRSAPRAGEVRNTENAAPRARRPRQLSLKF